MNVFPTDSIGILPVTPEFLTPVPASTHSQKEWVKSDMCNTIPLREKSCGLRQEAGKLEKHVKHLESLKSQVHQLRQQSCERRAFYEKQLEHARKANNSYHMSFYEQLIQKCDDRVAKQLANLQDIELSSSPSFTLSDDLRIEKAALLRLMDLAEAWVETEEQKCGPTKVEIQKLLVQAQRLDEELKILLEDEAASLKAQDAKLSQEKQSIKNTIETILYSEGTKNGDLLAAKIIEKRKKSGELKEVQTTLNKIEEEIRNITLTSNP